MAKPAGNESQSQLEFLPFDEKHYSEIRRKNIFRLLLTYLTPLILLILYFYFQYGSLISESQRFHLKAIAENQTNTLDLFLTERLVNLSNLIDDPRFEFPPSEKAMQIYLERLKKDSETFVDIGYFDSSGVQTAYKGPYPSLEKRNYSSESWYITLKDDDDNYIITDIYLGFRQKPHFTIAISRIINDQFIVLRATLDPGKIYEYISSLEGSNEVFTSIVNRAGKYQVVTQNIAALLEKISIVPPDVPGLGTEEVKINGSTITYAYSWLKTADWAVIVMRSIDESQEILPDFLIKLLGVSIAIILLIIFIIIDRARKLVEFQKESDRTRAQLEHAAKLASIGELASGIAHEINNPLAIITEEAGLVKDLMSPEFQETASDEEIGGHLDTIQEAAFRCRDITRKLLKFVRKTELNLQSQDIHQIVDGVLDGLLGQEISVSNIEIIRNYNRGLPQLITDANQLQQVLLNIINNGIDAFEGKPGIITVSTSQTGKNLNISISDNGKGIAPDQIEKLFMPFYSTKEVGEGTGLGLSVSYGIIKSLGGKIEVNSSVGEGSTFILVLPIK